jgi:hypothetical protein
MASRCQRSGAPLRLSGAMEVWIQIIKSIVESALWPEQPRSHMEQHQPAREYGFYST